MSFGVIAYGVSLFQRMKHASEEHFCLFSTSHEGILTSEYFVEKSPFSLIMASSCREPAHFGAINSNANRFTVWEWNLVGHLNIKPPIHQKIQRSLSFFALAGGWSSSNLNTPFRRWKRQMLHTTSLYHSESHIKYFLSKFTIDMGLSALV